MQNNLIEKENPITERTVILLDGRQVNTKLFSNYELENHDKLKIR